MPRSAFFLLCFLLTCTLARAQAGHAFVRKEAFLRLTLSKTTCYEGEPVLATWQLFRSISTQSRVVRQPAFTGFSVQELTTNSEVQTEVEKDGKFYKVDVVRKVILTPLQAGTFSLDSVVVEHVVPVPELKRNLMVTVGSQPQRLVVKPLPPGAREAAIGQFTLEARFTQPALWPGGTDTLELRVKGAGNFSRLPMPELQWPAGTRPYAAELDEDSVDRLSFPPAGSVRFLIPFTLVGGQAKLPATVSLLRFDPETGRTDTLRTALPPLKRIARPAPRILPASERPGYYRWLPFIALVPLLVASAFLFARRKKPAPVKTAVPEKQAPLAAVPAQEQYDHAAATEQLAAAVEADEFPALAAAALRNYGQAHPGPPPALRTLEARLEATLYGGAPLDRPTFVAAFAELPA